LDKRVAAEGRPIEIALLSRIRKADILDKATKERCEEVNCRRKPNFLEA
jgi:hypothetical protein